MKRLLSAFAMLAIALAFGSETLGAKLQPYPSQLRLVVKKVATQEVSNFLPEVRHLRGRREQRE